MASEITDQGKENTWASDFSNLPVADCAHCATVVTGYDKEDLAVYSDLLEAEADGADWDEAALLVPIDPVPERARRVWESHLARA